MSAKGLSRRELVAAAAALATTPAFARSSRGSTSGWKEDLTRYPHGVASGDPTSDGVMLWTRWEPDGDSGAQRRSLKVEVSEDEAFSRVIATATARVAPISDWTCRILVGGLKPDSLYWYRFVDETGRGSRIGRTRHGTNKKLENVAKSAAIRTLYFTPVQFLRDMRSAGEIAPDEFVAWDRLRNQVAHGSLVSPYSSAEEDKLLMDLSHLMHSVTRKLVSVLW